MSNKQTFEDITTILALYGSIPVTDEVSRKDVISHIESVYDLVFKKYMGVNSPKYVSLDDLKRILILDLKEHVLKEQDNEIIQYILDYMLMELRQDLFGKNEEEEEDNKNMEVKRSVRGGIIVDEKLANEIERLVLQELDYTSLMEKLSITRIPVLKSILYEVSKILGRVVNLDTDNERTDKHQIDNVRRTKNGISLTNNKIRNLVDGNIEIGTWFKVRVSKDKYGRRVITLQERTG